MNAERAWLFQHATDGDLGCADATRSRIVERRGYDLLLRGGRGICPVTGRFGGEARCRGKPLGAESGGGVTLPAETPAPQQVWATLDQAQRNAAYDNNGAVPGSAAWSEARTVASARFRAARPARLDIAYAPGARTAFDLYPAAGATAPCLVFIHGGYWQRNSREVFAIYAEGLARSGWSVAMPSHTLAPQASLTTIVAEIGLALDWLAQHGPVQGIAGPVILAGWSAGAHLTALHLGHPAGRGGPGDLRRLRPCTLARHRPERRLEPHRYRDRHAVTLAAAGRAEAARHRLRHGRDPGSRPRFPRSARPSGGRSRFRTSAAGRPNRPLLHPRRIASPRRPLASCRASFDRRYRLVKDASGMAQATPLTGFRRPTRNPNMVDQAGAAEPRARRTRRSPSRHRRISTGDERTQGRHLPDPYALQP